MINDIEVPHGVTSAPDGTRLYFTNEAMHTLDAVDATTLAVIARVPLSGRPNNVAISKDGTRVYVGIAQAPGAVDVIDTATLTRAKSIPVKGAIHNVYVTPDGKFVVSGLDSRAHDHGDRSGHGNDRVGAADVSAGIRPMTFDARPDGSTKNIYIQLSDYHGFAVVDFDARKEVRRVDMPDDRGRGKAHHGLQGAPAHGLGVTPDGKVLFSTSKVYSTMYAYSLPNLEPLGHVHVGQHPEWVTFSPDGRHVYVAAAGDNSTTVVDTKL